MIVCAYSTNDKYRAYALAMKASAEAFGLRVVLYEYPAVSDWRDGVNLKPMAILRAMDEYPFDSVLYVDADATFTGSPTELLGMDDHYDAAMHHQAKNHPLGGTLFFQNNPRGRRIVERWFKNIRSGPRIADDLNLKDALYSIPDRRIYHLPPAYCWHEKTMRPGYGQAKPIIIQESIGEHSF